MMSTEDRMKLWREVFVAAVRGGQTDVTAREYADFALEWYRYEFEEPSRVRRG